MTHNTTAHKAESEYLRAALDDERRARKVAGDCADRFRDVLSECLGYEDENPGDDVLVRDLRAHFGKAGPEPTRWRDFLTGALAVVDQINADRMGTRPGLPDDPDPACSALWSRNQGVSCHITSPHTVHRGSSEPDAPSWGDGECVPGTLTDGRGGR